MESSLFKNLDKNKAKFADLFDNSADYFFKPVKIATVQCAVVMCEDLTDSLKLWQIFLEPLNNMKDSKDSLQLFDYIKHETTIPFNPTTVDTFEKSMFFLTAGFALLLIDGVDKAMVMPVQGYPARGVDKPTNESNLRGSKESFTDTGRKNMGMIRRRIRSDNLNVKTLQIGSKTKTEITVYYHSDYCPENLANDVIERIKNIDLPVILETGYLTPFIDRTKGSLFQSVGYTERPDTFCAKLCEGKVGIMVDGTPYAMLYPYFFRDNFITNDDYTQRPYFASFIRILRYISFIIAVMLPGIYVAFTSYAPQALADKLLFYIYSSQNATPLPLFLEAVLIIILFEIIKEAGLRLPSPIGSTVSIVSALIIGDAAISAGLIGSALLIVIAISTISAFIIPSFYESIIIMRIIVVLFSGILGIPGLSFSLLFLFINIINVNSEIYSYANIFYENRNILFSDGLLKSSWRNHKGETNTKSE